MADGIALLMRHTHMCIRGSNPLLSVPMICSNITIHSRIQYCVFLGFFSYEVLRHDNDSYYECYFSHFETNGLASNGTEHGISGKTNKNVPIKTLKKLHGTCEYTVKNKGKSRCIFGLSFFAAYGQKAGCVDSLFSVYIFSNT